jgi:hypothetical protein
MIVTNMVPAMPVADVSALICGLALIAACVCETYEMRGSERRRERGE